MGVLLKETIQQIQPGHVIVLSSIWFSTFSLICQETVYPMNAIVALCHFCESHGPCILFCTQVSVVSVAR